MKTLDEVIKAWSICFSDNSRSNCTGCPYADEDGESACFNHDREDALHYLKEYREMLNVRIYIPEGYTREKTGFTHQDFANTFGGEPHFIRDFMVGTSRNFADTSQITCPKCHSEFVILPEANNALTWDELRTMEGKPVWVKSSDSFNRRRWMFVGEWFDDDEMRLFDMGNDYPDYVSKNGYESGRWQAYRKERADES